MQFRGHMAEKRIWAKYSTKPIGEKEALIDAIKASRQS
jgi:hypothetical protein